jgi:uncharacterized protein (TIGR03083 family)
MLLTLHTTRGVADGLEMLRAEFGAQRRRILEVFRSLTADDWTHATRCDEWNAHQLARHVVSAAQMHTAIQRSEPLPFPLRSELMDPRTDPKRWLLASEGESPEQTLAAMERSFGDELTAFDSRGDADDDDMVRSPYGPVHWSILGAHVLWDTWLHERDLLLPLGRSSCAGSDEDRLAGAYGLLISLVPLTLSRAPFEVTVRLTGPGGAAYSLETQGPAVLVQTLGAGTGADLQGELHEVTDALSGRGQPVQSVLAGNPETIAAISTIATVLAPAR